MIILGIDSSGLVASVAVLRDGEIIGEYTINYKKTHSQTLLPMLDELVKMLELKLEQIDAIAVAGGPGSFTGLRIGAATAKGLGLALDKPIVSVPTVDSLAYNLFGTDKIICPIMDARRNQVYTGLYEFQGKEFNVILQQNASSIEDILLKVKEVGRDVIFLGDGVPVYQEIIQSILKTGYFFAPPHLARQRAASIAALGAVYFDKGVCESAQEHKPVYLRLSQAERELLEKQNER
ncbi:tRNA (adenosine(37)-N6)-threonylcarbamoyltransferase complex dimerization subunit type 1 TsaB [Anaeromicropila populeti]|uniref:tRNA threonylcarbamoyl adenosine modification protein YeaZ n=1 Tax=Anaeromicropila populeti TaxID=37658 RepID=A0A1I6J3F9_9FIRM|nr:tRNA (adenosine(37)-N6)-threonylcarbamoyltransferase complex dimerization subunit type 1 TsaB [Anaeromicropila populeti]SFR73562.1 tRNA threonylcarbamoyl adenosine modification protein YeaZ [Anaeromicropila populeti]